jgi:dTDP-4-dehydrorhamnose reductase
VNVLVTGALGQLGLALKAALASHELVALPRGDLDIADLDAVREVVRMHRPDLIINAAAYNRVDDAEADAAAAYRGNALGPRNLALASADIAIPLVHVSTDYVFDGRGTRPYHEFDRPDPQSAYGRSKLAGEVAVRELNPRHYIVRTAWVYDAQGGNFPRTILSLSARPEVRVVDDQTGSPTYAPHLAAAIARLIPSAAFGTYHFAGQGAVTWCGLTRQLYELRGIRTPVVAVTSEEFPRPAPRPRYSVLTTLQEPRIVLPPWQDGLAEFCRALDS